MIAVEGNKRMVTILNYVFQLTAPNYLVVLLRRVDKE